MTTENVQLYRDADQPVAARVEDLLARMTLDQKLAQVGCVWSTALVEDGAVSDQKASELLANGTGHITRIGSTTALRPRESAAFMNQIQGFLASSRRVRPFHPRPRSESTEPGVPPGSADS